MKLIHKIVYSAIDDTEFLYKKECAQYEVELAEVELVQHIAKFCDTEYDDRNDIQIITPKTVMKYITSLFDEIASLNKQLQEAKNIEVNS